MTNKTLEQLYTEHCGKVSDKWSLYLVEYERIFAEYRDRPVRLLEIGIQNGGSLEIWSKYFRHARRLVGCDISPDCARLSYEDPRVAVVVGDANSDTVQTEVLGYAPAFDVIIDDGSHRSSDIVKSFARYFPHLADGGVFVAEDLHCSYWQEFEGGLFAPFSSITFFKRLADVVSHEHWGIEKNRVDILSGFFAKYGSLMNEEALRHIHSVEFINSMCVIRKNRPLRNRLGARIIAGSVGTVVSGDELYASLEATPDQAGNEWTARSAPPEEEILLRIKELAERDGQIAGLNQAVAERDGQIAALYNSTSWRFTWPLRIVVHQIKRARRVVKLARPAIQCGGGTFKKAIQLYRSEGLAGIRRGFRIVARSCQTIPTPGSGEFDRNDYDEWIRRYDTLTDESRATMHARIDGFSHKPRISVVMPTYNPKPEWLSQAIESVRKQIYPHWELCIADDASTDQSVRPALERYARDDSRIKVVFREQNGHISAASNSALDLATGEWVVLLDHDDLLTEHALFWVADAINQNPDVRLIYSDEDKIDKAGRRISPYFKCDWNVDLFYSHNLITHLGVYRSELLREIGGFREGLEGAQDYDLALRCIERIAPKQIHHIPRVLYHWRMHTESTAQSLDAKPYAMFAGERALNEHFQRLGVKAEAKFDGHGFRVRRSLPDTLPMVSLIIPTRNGLHLIRQCVESILKKTSYSNYEILIVDNGSDEPAMLKYLKQLELEKKAQVVRDACPFNYSALNNAAVKVARGEIVGLLNNDIEVISPDWLSEMVSHALQPDVGVVGARLWYPNETLQHGGVILGVGGVAGHSHKHLPRHHPGYFGRASIVQSLSAVTAACLVTRKAIYEDVGGLNETDLQIAFNDVDFCLRVREAGYRNIWTPYAELYHHESASRGYEDSPEKQARFAKEVQYMKQRWGDLLLNDPAYSPNLTLNHEDFCLAWPSRIVSVPQTPPDCTQSRRQGLGHG
ncbi:MAG: glycosyltransferase [Sulfuricaulis sp.]|uniref:glycosyltransferase n=1 Tax=Sulfuricaulis sp. TaxID=2003553 RepID=UPI003C408944